MSLINQMLKDLESRRQADDSTTPHKAAVTACHSVAPRRIVPLVLIAVFVIAAIIVGGSWWLQTKSTVSIAEHALLIPPAPPVLEVQSEKIDNVAGRKADARNMAVAVNEVVTVELPTAVPKTKMDASLVPTVSLTNGTELSYKDTVVPTPMVKEKAPPVPVVKAAAKEKTIAKASVVVAKKRTAQHRAQLLYKKAQRLQRKGNYAASVAPLQQALRLYGKNAEIWHSLAITNLYLRQPQAAIDSVARGLQANPGDIALATLQARLLLEMGKKEQALQSLQQLEAPAIDDNPTYYALLATLQQQTQDYAAALETYASLTVASPRRGEWWIGRAICAEQLHDPDAARNYFRRAVNCPGLSEQLKNFVMQQLIRLDKR